MDPTFHMILDGFYPQAAELRAVFDERFANPRSTREDRFVWDYWHVPGQYTHLRTPAWEYFPEAPYKAFHEALVRWGRRTLGCWDVSPPWLSCYVEGHQQLLHSDVPHGPWAWVYSLTPAERRFSGGETAILRPEVLDYWPRFTDAEDRELTSFVTLIPPEHDRLVVFDPRFPHGVQRVSGTQDPREGRLVIHGWFTEPRPFVEGGHSSEAVDAALEPTLNQVAEDLAELGRFHGLLSVRLDVEAGGGVAESSVLANTLVSLETPGDVEADAVEQILTRLGELAFGAADEGSQVTLPLLLR